MIKLKVTYYPPFDSLLGKKKEEIEIKETSITVSEFLKLLLSKYPQLKSYIVTESDEKLGAQMSIVGDTELLRLDDELKEGKPQEIKLLPPIVGGFIESLKR